jgi:hypothetical protein
MWKTAKCSQLNPRCFTHFPRPFKLRPDWTLTVVWTSTTKLKDHSMPVTHQPFSNLEKRQIDREDYVQFCTYETFRIGWCFVHSFAHKRLLDACDIDDGLWTLNMSGCCFDIHSSSAFNEETEQASEWTALSCTSLAQFREEFEVHGSKWLTCVQTSLAHPCNRYRIMKRFSITQLKYLLGNWVRFRIRFEGNWCKWGKECFPFSLHLVHVISRHCQKPCIRHQQVVCISSRASELMQFSEGSSNQTVASLPILAFRWHSGAADLWSTWTW